MWLDPATNKPILATTLGLPLDDVMTSQGTGCTPVGGVPPLPTISDAATTPGPSFCASVAPPYAPGDPNNVFQMEIVPLAPFGVFPPLLEVVQVQPFGATLQQTQIPLSPPVYDQVNTNLPSNPIRTTSFTVQKDPGAPSIAGWTMYLLNADGRRISGRVALADQTTQNVTLYDATGSTNKSGDTLFIDPPSGIDLPRMSFIPVGTTGFFLPTLDPYPALPPVNTQMSGFVRRAEGFAAVAARITFVADGPSLLFNSFVSTTADGKTQATQLFYTKSIATTSGGQWSFGPGGSASSLPPGTYRVYVTPDDPSLAITVTDSQIVSSTTSAGVTFYVNPRTHIKGRVVLGDSTPVYGASVVIDPSADAPFAAHPDPLLLPRESTGSTDINGNFDVLSDSGAVDISIRPPDGSNLPWVVLTNRLVAPTTPSDGGGLPAALDLGNIVVPLPTPYPPAWGVPAGQRGLLTYSQQGFVVPRAIIRAYAFPSPAPVADGGTVVPRGARLVGMTMSDDRGNFQLFTVPPDP